MRRILSHRVLQAELVAHRPPACVIRAVLFDLDGTLVDTEGATDAAIAVVMAHHGVPDVTLPAALTRGRTWGDIAEALLARHVVPSSPEGLEDALLEAWLARAADAPPIPGAVDAIAHAAERFAIGVVSSSPRAVIDLFLEHLCATHLVPEVARIGAAEVVRPKPNPEGFLLAAKRLGVEPAQCLVFEDSVAGLEAAKAAGMASIAVLYAAAEPERLLERAQGAVESYVSLPETFWATLETEGASALGAWR